jgi:hypothetical protein
MTDKHLVFYDETAKQIPVKAVDNGDGTYSLDVNATISTGAITLGAVTVKDDLTATQANVAVATVITASSHAVAVKDPTTGQTDDPAVAVDATGTVNSHVRGLVAILADVRNAVTHYLRIGGAGTAGTPAGGVLTVQGDTSGTPMPVSLSAGVTSEIKSGDSALTARVAMSTSVSAGDNALATHDPTVGQTTDASTATTLVGLLKAIKAFFGAGLPASLSSGYLTVSLKEVLYEMMEGVNGSNLQVTTDYVHEYVHQGALWTTSIAVPSLANSGDSDCYIVTGSDMCHLVSAIQAEGACTLNIYEDAVGSNGTVLTPTNLNRNVATTPTTVIRAGATITSVGTLLFTFYLPGGTGGGKAGGFIRQGTEIVMKPNTAYLYRTTNVSGNAIRLAKQLEFYELNI